MEIFLIIDCFQCLINPNGWITLIIGSLISALIPYLMYTMKPKLKILDPILNENLLNIKIENKSKCSDAVNLKIEACIIKPNENLNNHFFTYSLELDQDDFLILPIKDIRTFTTNKIRQSTLDILIRENPDLNNLNCNDKFKELILKLKENTSYYLRIRIYAQHDYSGFGKAYQLRFKWNKKNKKFEEFFKNN